MSSQTSDSTDSPDGWRVILTEQAAEDLKGLDGSLRPHVAARLRKLRHDAHTGRPLRDALVGCRKVRVRGVVRIVYMLQGDVAHVLAIGMRRDKEVYRMAEKRRARM
jgi:mRNA-degrading endonuclease RelE of RelBE toxin-antitoxin system